ncbi:MAG TPA: hypothetical protein VGI70_15635, partial [Polyangiales bacterium]
DAGVCPASLADRIAVTSIDLSVDIRYKRASYDYFPVDERISLGVRADGSGHVAWIDDASGNIRVTPLTSSLSRSGDDVVVPGTDIGGFVEREDGFALLTRRADPGDPETDPNASGAPALAALLVRYRGDSELFAAPLTGTTAITHARDPAARDCTPPFLYGRLAWNGVKYGAYFQVHGCSGDPHASYYGDKLVYADDLGRAISGGWDWNCSENQGLRLLAEPDIFTSICLSDQSPNPGLNLVVEGVPTQQLGAEWSMPGYVAAQLGSLVKLGDGGYMIAWLSRGVDASHPAAAKMADDIAAVRLGSDYGVIAPKTWWVETPSIAETNLHVVRYGSDRLLVIWETITNPRCSATTCFGDYGGTFARLIDEHGHWLTAQTAIAAVPNTGEDLIILPNGDVAWAFVPDDARNYEAPITRDRNDVPVVPSKHSLSIARMRVCE